MKRNIFALIRVLFAFILIMVLLFVQRVGILYDADNNTSLIVDDSYITSNKEAMDTYKSLFVVSTSDSSSEKAEPELEQILTDLRINYEMLDIDEGTDITFSEYESVFISVTSLDKLKDSVDDMESYVESGGDVVFLLPLLTDDTLKSVKENLGIETINSGYKLVDTFTPIEGFMLGGLEDYTIVDGYESSMNVELLDDANVYAYCDDCPIIWQYEKGNGSYIVCNFAYSDKAYRGIYSSAISLIGDVFMYPVICASTFYLDDFPSPVPGGDATYIKRDYGMDIAEFYTNVWWPDVLALGKEYDIDYTGLIIETYNDQTSGTLPDNNNTSDYYYYGNMLLNAGGEVGYHGYNHQPLCTTSFTYTTDLGYNLWEDTDEIKDALTKVTKFATGIFPSSTLQVYVPPSNVISDEGIEVIEDNFEDIRCIASTYLPGDNVYVQEYSIDEESDIINTPRVVSGGVKDDYLRFAAVSEMNFHFVASHFMHPDDLLDVDRGAELGWESIKSTVEEYMIWIDDTAPGIRHLTGSGMAGAVQRYCNVSFSIEEKDDNNFEITTNGIIDESYFLLRANNGMTPTSDDAEISNVYGNIYLVKITKDTTDIVFE